MATRRPSRNTKKTRSSKKPKSSRRPGKRPPPKRPPSDDPLGQDELDPFLIEDPPTGEECPNGIVAHEFVIGLGINQESARDDFDARAEERRAELHAEWESRCRAHRCDNGSCEVDSAIKRTGGAWYNVETTRERKIRFWLVRGLVFAMCTCEEAG